MRRLLPGRRPADERGIVVIWVAVCMVVFLGFAAWAVDYAHWNSERSRMQKAADAAALAGAVYLPDDPGGAVAAAQTVAAQNGFSGGVSASVGSNPNQLKVTVGQSVRNTFGVAIGVGQTNLSRHAVAEYESPQPLDMVLVVDRTRSMLTPSAATLQNLKDATLDLFGYMDPRNESIALGVLGPSDRTKTCTGANAGAYGVASAVSDVTAPSNTWMAAPFPTAPPVTDYRNASSQIVKTVKCLATANSPLGFTDLGDPIAAATTYLNTHGRPGSKRGIILMTDGAANLPTGTQPCGYANT
jgi:Flp pilus assembly protein TadG